MGSTTWRQLLRRKKKREYNIEIIKDSPSKSQHSLLYILQEVTPGNITSPTSLWETHFACRSAPRCLCMVDRCICSGCLQSSETDGITIICFTLAPHTHKHTHTFQQTHHRLAFRIDNVRIDKVVSLYFCYYRGLIEDLSIYRLYLQTYYAMTGSLKVKAKHVSHIVRRFRLNKDYIRPILGFERFCEAKFTQ